MKRLFFIIALFGFWNYAKGQSNYFPINEGKNLTYAFGKEIYGGTPYEGYRFQVSILDAKEEIDGKEYFISETSTGSESGEKTIIRSYLRFGDDGSVISKVSKDSSEQLVLQKNPKIGDSYASQQAGTAKVLDLNATIKTPIMTYTNCLMIETEENQTISRVYYQENIGMVAATTFTDGSEKIFIYLISE
jgi:hypothetical protein